MKGFTLIELIIIMGIFAILFGLSSISLLNVTRHSTLSADVDTLLTDFKQQQTKAMTGDGQGGNFGLELGPGSSYSLFHGIPTDPDKTVINMTSTNQISPSLTVTFEASKSGDTTPGTIIVRNTTSNEQKTIQFNRHGVVTSIN